MTVPMDYIRVTKDQQATNNKKKAHQNKVGGVTTAAGNKCSGSAGGK